MKKVNILGRMVMIVSLILIMCIVSSANEFDGYIVKLAEPYATFDTLSSESDITALEYSENLYVVDDIDTVNMLKDEGCVVYAEPNYVLELLGSAPNDTYYSEQWSLDAINYSALYGTEYNGSGVTVAVIDSGLDTSHPDFADTIISSKSKNFLGDGSHADAFYRDQLGHGTFVTSQIATSTNNNEGIASIAYGAEIMVLRCVAKNTSAKFAYDLAYDDKSATIATVCSAIDYAVQNGADVINISLGITSDSSAIAESVASAISKGIIVVAAVGNSGGTKMYYPANCDGVIGVGSISEGTNGYTKSSFSQHNTSVDVVAPGGNVLGILIYPDGDGVWYSSPAESYCKDNGTSFSSPLVASLAAIAKQIDPELDSAGFLSLLAETSNDLGDIGYDTYYGYGYVDAKKLLDELTKADVTVTTESITAGEVYDSIFARASGSEFALYDVTVSGTEEKTTVTVPFNADSVYVYNVAGDYLVKTEAVCANGSVLFESSGGVYVVSDTPLVLYGDANADGETTLLDVIRIFKRTVSDEVSLDIAAADISGDCEVTLVDVLCVINVLLNN